jgi:hypothetical protein
MSRRMMREEVLRVGKGEREIHHTVLIGCGETRERGKKSWYKSIGCACVRGGSRKGVVGAYKTTHK